MKKTITSILVAAICLPTLNVKAGDKKMSFENKKAIAIVVIDSFEKLDLGLD